MDKSLKDLESRLESLTPRGLSDRGRRQCVSLIDRLAKGESPRSRTDADSARSTLGVSWKIATAAASVTLALGLGGGWWLGRDAGLPMAGGPPQGGEIASLAYEVLNRETLLTSSDPPKVYVSEEGEVREIFSEVAVTKEVVKDPGSGQVVTVETTDHHLVDSAKNEF